MKFGRCCWFGKLVALSSLSYGGKSKFFVFGLVFVGLLLVVVGFGFIMFVQGGGEVGLSLSVEPLLDKYGMPAINDDGTFYPTDRFEVAYHTELAAGVVFEEMQVVYDGSVFSMFDHSDFNSSSGACSFTVLSSAVAGTYKINFNAYGSGSVGNATQSYAVEASVAVVVVEYDPHFSVDLVYSVPNVGGNGSSFEAPFVLIVRYDGNGVDFNLCQRAVVDDFFWAGYAQKLPDLSTVQVMPNVSVSNFFSKGANVQFLVQDITAPISQPVVVIDGVSYSSGDFPKEFFWDVNTNHTYVWAQNLTVSGGSGSGGGGVGVEEWFEWAFCSVFPPSFGGLDLSLVDSLGQQEGLQNQLLDQFNSLEGSLTTTQLGCTVTAMYTHNKLLELFAQSVGVNRDQVLQGLTDVPLYFNAEARYAKLQYILDDRVAKEIDNQGFTTALYYNISAGCNLFGQPKYFEANVTVDYEFFCKRVNATAYRWDLLLQGWGVDDSVGLCLGFESAFSFTEGDVLRSNFEEQTSDSTALKMAMDDLYDCGLQSFVGVGSLEGDLRRSSPLYYDFLVEAGRSSKVSLQRTVELNFRTGQPYNLPLNFDSNSPLGVSVLADDTQSVLLLLDAPFELGGLTNATVYLVTSVPSEGWDALSKSGFGLELLKTVELSVPQEQAQMPLSYEQNFEQFYSYYEGGGAVFDGNWGFEGQTQLALSKDQNVVALTPSGEALLYVEATNVWGTVFHEVVEVQPYVKPKWEFSLSQVALYLLVIVIIAIIVSFIVYFVKGGGGG